MVLVLWGSFNSHLCRHRPLLTRGVQYNHFKFLYKPGRVWEVAVCHGAAAIGRRRGRVSSVRARSTTPSMPPPNSPSGPISLPSHAALKRIRDWPVLREHGVRTAGPMKDLRPSTETSPGNSPCSENAERFGIRAGPNPSGVSLNLLQASEVVRPASCSGLLGC